MLLYSTGKPHEYICDARRTLMGGGSHTRRLAAPAKLSALGHQCYGFLEEIK